MQTKLRAATKLVRATTLALRLKRHLESRLVKRKVYEQVHLKQVAEIEKSLEDALRPMFEQQLKDVAASLRLLARSEKGGPGSGPRPGQGSAHPAGWTNRINTTGSGDGQIVDKHGKSWIVQHEAIHNDGKVKHRYTITWEGAPKGVSAGGAETSWDRNRIMSVQVHTEYQRMGLASALYDHIEKHLGHKLERNWATTSDGEAFWNAREGQKNAAEKNCGTGAGGFKPGNQCARGGISISTTEEADHILKSFGQSKESVAASTGAVEGSTVKIREYKDDKDGSLLVIIEHAGYSAERTVFRNHIVNDRLMVFDNGQGLGTQVLKSQVDAASSNGYKRIETLAAGQQGSHQNGYYTWPRLGYDGNILPTIKQKAQKEFPGVSKVSDLMKTLEGRDWWKKNGRGFDAEFDLTPGSQSRKVLDEYVKAKFGGSDGGKSTGDVGRGRKDLGPDLGQDRSGCKATGVSASDVFNPRDWDEDLVNRALPPIAVASAKAMQAQLKLMGLDIVRVKKSLKGGPGSGPRPGQGRKPSPPTDDEIDKAGDDLYDLMREYHNTNDKKILSYIAEFGHPSAREAEKEAAKLTLDDKLKFDESGKTTLYRGEGGKIKKQEFHKDDLIAALPWEGEVIVRGESGPVSWTSDERWAQRFATYEHFADNIAGKSFEKGGPGSGPRVRLPMSQRQTEEARKKREERANTQIPSSVNLPEHLYLALPKAVAERAVEHGHSGETKGLLAHEENRKDSVYLATDPNVVKHYAAMTEGSVTFKIRTNSLDRGRMYYDAFEPPNEPGKAPFGDENPGYVAYRGKIPAEVFQSASQEKSYKSFEDEKNCGTGAGGFKPGNQCARGGVSFGGNVVDHGGGDADQAVHALFGRILTDDEISGLAGAPSGSNVKIVGVARSRFHIHWTNGNLKAEAERSVEGDYGHVHIENRYFETQRTSEGVGTQVFAHQVEQASKLGVKYISTDAAGHYGGELNGYYTWPRLGYDSKIPESVSGRARNKFPGVERLSDLMKTQQGRQWWKVEGFGSPMTFNLNEGSQSRKVLDEYVKAKFGGSGVEDGKSTGDDGRGRKDLGPDLGQDRQGGSGVKASGVSASDVFNPRDWDEDLVNRALPPIAVASAKAMQAQLKLMGLDIVRVKKSLKGGPGSGPRPRGGSSSEISDQEAKQRAKEVWSPADFQFKSYNGGVSRTDAEQKAVEYWTYVKNSQKINQALRTNDRSDSEVSGAINNIDNIMKKSSLPGDVVSYRAVLLSKEPESGDKIHSVGYSATTLDSTFAKKHAENLISGADTGAGRFSDVSGIPVVMKVLLPKGSRVTTGAQSALELLVDRNSSFRVISKTKSSVFAVLEQDNVEEFKSTKASTATEWLESHQNDDRFKDLEDQVFTTPYGNVTLKIVTEYPQWMKDKIVEHLEDTFGQDYWKEINDTTFGQVDDYLKKGIQDGWSIARMADELAETLGGGDYAEWRARNIARTESGNALNGARVAAADGLIEDLGRDLPIKKVWMSVLGSTTRRSHANLDGVPADKNGRWRLGGVMCRWPGDTNLSAGERCNCQCTVIVEFGMGDDEVQQLLADYETRLITQEKEFRVWLKNCGIGSGGFQPGNTCARGGGGGSGVSKLTGNKAEAQIHASSVQELDSKWNGKLSQFLEKNPVHIHVGKVDGMGDSSGVYNAGRKRIAVKEASKSGAWNLYEPGASIAVDVASKSDSNVEHQKVTFTHELGHHLALTVTNKNKSAYLDEIISRFQKDDKKVSKYAETHPQEYFAESFAAYHHAPGKLNSTSRAMVESIMTIALE